MRKSMLAASLVLVCWLGQTAEAAFTLAFDSGDFGITGTFNDVSFFAFDVVVDDTLQLGKTYSNPLLGIVNYRVNGVLDNATPSGFPGFGLVRSIPGNEFYSLSPDAALNFTIANTADLSDGLQIGELLGTGTVLTLNAREFNQSPGRYHPPILTFNGDGSGRLVNANNASTFPNPDPPIGSGMLVNVGIADEYDVALTFGSDLTIVASTVPEPASVMFACIASFVVVIGRRSRAKMTSE